MNITKEAPMKFSNLELLAMSGLIDHTPLYGIDLEDKAVPDEETTEKQYAQILNGLHEKKIMADHHFTHDGIRIIEVLRTYKTARAYIFLNEWRMSLNRDDSITLIVKQLDGAYCFLRTWPPVFVNALAAMLPWLNQADGLVPTDPITYLHTDSWLGDILNYSMNRPDTPESGIQDMLIVRHHRKDAAAPLESLIYYRKENHCYLYNEHNRQHRKVPGLVVRQQLRDMFTCSEAAKKSRH